VGRRRGGSEGEGTGMGWGWGRREKGEGREMGRTHEFEDVAPGVEVVAGGSC